MVPSQPSSSKQRGDAPRVQLPSNRPPAAKEPKITVQEPTGEARDYKRMVLVRRPIRRQVGTETRQVLRRKAPRRGKGFRIAVYSGGNTREDRNKAELAGQKVKDALPDQPVYVHFYPHGGCALWAILKNTRMHRRHCGRSRRPATRAPTSSENNKRRTRLPANL